MDVAFRMADCSWCVCVYGGRGEKQKCRPVCTLNVALGSLPYKRSNSYRRYMCLAAPVFIQAVCDILKAEYIYTLLHKRKRGGREAMLC